MGREALVAALERAVEFRRFRFTDVRSILEAGAGVPTLFEAGETLVLDLPAVPVRSLEDYGREGLGSAPRRRRSRPTWWRGSSG